MDVTFIIQQAGSVGKLSQMLGVSHSTVCGWKRDRCIPGSRAADIATLLDLPINEVITLVRPARSALRRRGEG